MTVHRNAELIEDLSGDFPHRDDAGFSWMGAMSALQMLPGLCGLWTMGSLNNSDYVVDGSGQGQTLEVSGGVTFGMDGLAPYADFDGTNGYLVHDVAAKGQFVPLGSFLSSTSWDGDQKNTSDNGTIDLSAVFGAPAGIKAIYVYMAVNEDSTGDTRYMSLGPDSSNPYACMCRSMVNGVVNSTQGIVPCDANGDVYVKLGGDNIGGCVIRIWGYWT